MHFRQPNLANELFCPIWEVVLSIPGSVREGALSVSSLSERVLYVYLLCQRRCLKCVCLYSPCCDFAYYLLFKTRCMFRSFIDLLCLLMGPPLAGGPREHPWLMSLSKVSQFPKIKPFWPQKAHSWKLAYLKIISKIFYWFLFTLAQTFWTAYF